MKADHRFDAKPPEFWSSVRFISQEVGYTERKARGTDTPGRVRVPTEAEIADAFTRSGLDPDKLADGNPFAANASDLIEYFDYRSSVLQDHVAPRLQDADDARLMFEAVRSQFPQVAAKLERDGHLPLNKQKGTKRTFAYLTCTANILVAAGLGDRPVDFDPRRLTMATHDGAPLRTLARRLDGAFPRTIDPLAVWEIKEYYFTTTFGSRVADGVYETLLDGLELEELERAYAALGEDRRVNHLLLVDSHYTWWMLGRSYLCRLIDLLNMGRVSEILFGNEVVTQLPSIVDEWARAYDAMLRSS